MQIKERVRELALKVGALLGSISVIIIAEPNIKLSGSFNFELGTNSAAEVQSLHNSEATLTAPKLIVR